VLGQLRPLELVEVARRRPRIRELGRRRVVVALGVALEDLDVRRQR
jgi:hypothetical protein